ncbi:MAG: DUF2249 domain-containing protein [Candidatus Microthrix sp.]|nr:DUF2249 domain-containing protein [Candidatus Microthrix sp.]MBK7321572.1 DUF2249 domain-containing protein [Candidatus Microthrix sp.]
MSADNLTGDTGEVLLDVRPIIERGEEPSERSCRPWPPLMVGPLLLVAPFEPTPLEGVLAAQGYTYQSERVTDTEWRVRFEPADAGAGAGAVATDQSEAKAVAESPFTIKSRTSPCPRLSNACPSATHAPQQRMPHRRRRCRASVMAMDPTQNVPPAWLPLGFLAAAGAGLIGFGVAMMVTAPTAVTFPRDDHVLAAVHFGVLAFLSAAVLGALHQFGPVVGAKPLRSVPAACSPACCLCRGHG